MNLEALLPGEFEFEGRIVGQSFGISGYLHQASFVELDNGDLLVACGGTKIPGHSGGDYSGCWTYLWRLPAETEVWEQVPTPFSGHAVDDKLCTSNPCILRLPDRLVMLSRSASGYAWESLTYVITSLDNGKTWGSYASEGTDWTWTTIIEFDNEKGDTAPPTGDGGFNQAGPCCYSCRPIRLKSGRLLLALAASWHEEPPSTTRGGSYYFRSDDDGATWQYHGMIERPPTGEVLCEPANAELPDGRLVALVRSYNTVLLEDNAHLTGKGSRYYYLAVSEDEGATWSQPWPCYLGSERWNGAMADLAIVGDCLYALGSFSQFQPADFLGHSSVWAQGTQRTPLLLMQIPLEQLNSERAGAYDLVPKAIRPVGITLNQDLKLAPKYASVQLDTLSDGCLGVLCDTHTGSYDENDILFWKIHPQWMEKDGLALWRGPVPGVYSTGSIRVLNTQTTIRPTRFPVGQLPLRVESKMTVQNLERRECIRQNLFTIWTTADLNVPATPYPNALFASLDVNTKLARDGSHQFVVNTGAGIVDIDLSVHSYYEYDIAFDIPDRWQWFLMIDGHRFGPFSPVAPGLPGSLTLAHEMHPARDIDVSFQDIQVESQGQALLLPHPFLIDEFDLADDSVAGTNGAMQFHEEGHVLCASLTGSHWIRWLRYGGVAGVYKGIGDGELFSVHGNGEALVSLSIMNGDLIATLRGKLLTCASEGSGSFSLAGSALHERTYLSNGERVARPIRQPFMPAEVASELELKVSNRMEHLWLTGWDAPPAGQLRLLGK